MVAISPAAWACGGWSPPGHVTVTEADGAHAIQLHPGQILEVRLRQAEGWAPWREIESSEPAVLRQLTPVEVDGPTTLASFQAVAAGGAVVIAFAGRPCAAGAPCPSDARGYRLEVRVG
jgi:hypothetical protein